MNLMLKNAADAGRSSAGTLLRQRRVRVGAVLAVAAALAVILWLILSGGGNDHGPKYQVKPVPISASGLKTLAGAVPTPIYWAGPLTRRTYELSRTEDGKTYIRYLPPGVEVGSDKPFLTVATYPFARAYQATESAARRRGAVRIAVGPGTIAFYNKSRPQSIFLAQAGSNFQVEVYAPSPDEARALVAGRRIVPVQGRVPTAKAASAAGLKALAHSLGHPLYWLGAKAGFTYELTQTGDGRIFIRYLPRGVKVGAKRPYLTIATYPYQNAFAAIQAAARRKGAVKIKLPGGGLAVVDGAYPRSIHLAYPGSNYQVEVFDPSPTQTRQVVSSGEVQEIR
jgi:hypothetical protein